jgi:hypothetical protein
MLQPLHEIVQQLLCEGLMGANLLWNFFSHRVQSLRQWEMTMWMYPGPSYPDRPFSEELGDTEINTQIHRVLAHGVNLNPGDDPTPLRERVDNTRVSPLRPIFGCLCQFWSLNTFVFLRRVSGVLTASHGWSPYLRMWRDRKQTISTMIGCTHGDREDRPGVPLGRR